MSREAYNLRRTGRPLGLPERAAAWHDQYTPQMLHVWVVPYLGGPFSDDLSRAATNAAVRAVLGHK